MVYGVELFKKRDARVIEGGLVLPIEDLTKLRRLASRRGSWSISKIETSNFVFSELDGRELPAIISILLHITKFSLLKQFPGVEVRPRDFGIRDYLISQLRSNELGIARAQQLKDFFELVGCIKLREKTAAAEDAQEAIFLEKILTLATGKDLDLVLLCESGVDVITLGDICLQKIVAFVKASSGEIHQQSKVSFFNTNRSNFQVIRVAFSDFNFDIIIKSKNNSSDRRLNISRTRTAEASCVIKNPLALPGASHYFFITRGQKEAMLGPEKLYPGLFEREADIAAVGFVKTLARVATQPPIDWKEGELLLDKEDCAKANSFFEAISQGEGVTEGESQSRLGTKKLEMTDILAAEMTLNLLIAFYQQPASLLQTLAQAPALEGFLTFFSIQPLINDSDLAMTIQAQLRRDQFPEKRLIAINSFMITLLELMQQAGLVDQRLITYANDMAEKMKLDGYVYNGYGRPINSDLSAIIQLLHLFRVAGH